MQTISINLEGWSKYIDNPADKAHATEELHKLQTAAGNLRQRAPFAHYQVVAASMFFESRMFALLKAKSEYRRGSFKAYGEYFVTAKDPQTEGSIAYARAILKKRQSDIEARHSELHKNLPIRCPFGSDAYLCNRGTRCPARRSRVVEGDLTNGYRETGAEVYYVRDTSKQCVPNIIGCPQDYVSPVPGTIGCAFLGEAEREGPNLNAERDEYLKVLTSIQRLDAALRTVDNFNCEAERLAGVRPPNTICTKE